MGSAKRRSSGALQNLADLQGSVTNAPASWTAAVLRRFWRASGLGSHGSWKASTTFVPCIGTLNPRPSPAQLFSLRVQAGHSCPGFLLWGDWKVANRQTRMSALHIQGSWREQWPRKGAESTKAICAVSGFQRSDDAVSTPSLFNLCRFVAIDCSSKVMASPTWFANRP